MITAITSSILAANPALASGSTAASAPARPSAPLGGHNIEARLSFDKELAQIIITLCDRDTGEVVRQIPPEKVLQFAQFLLQRSTGRLLDARA